jgi:hypothetical protein
MSYRSVALVAVVAAISSTHIGSAAAQSVYVAPGGVYVAPGAGPVHVTPPAPINGAAAYVAPNYGPGYGTAAYVHSAYNNGCGCEAANIYGYDGPGNAYGPGPYVAYVAPRPYVAPTYGYAYGPGPYVGPRYGYGYGPRPYAAPRDRFAYGPVVPNRRYYNGPRSAYAAAPPPRPRVGVPYQSVR